MPRLTLITLVSVSALFLTALATWQLMICLRPPAWRVALWLPFAGLLPACETGYSVLWLVPYPAFAVVFVVASRRWPAV